MGESPDLSEVYRPPGVDISPPRQASPPAATPEFYLVSPAKFIILFLCTMGIYSVYWLYRNFRQSKLALRDDTWPLARTVFAIFFTHSLFRRIDAQGGQFRADFHATLFVILTIAARILDRVESHVEPSGGLAMAGTLVGMATLFPLYAAQKAANRALGDPEGDQNSRLTWANWIWCGLGLLAWFLIVLGTLLPEP